MSETIPPSLVLITIGSVTGVSIAALFTGGLMPALVLAAALAFIARWRGRNEDMGGVVRPPWSVIGRAFVVALPALVLPFVIRTAVIEGIATATEVSTIGIVYAVIVGVLVYRQFPLRRLYPMLVETAALSGAILLIIGTATGMAWALTQSGFSRQLAAAMASMPGGAAGFMAVSILAFVVLGSVLEGIPAIVLFGPLLFPLRSGGGDQRGALRDGGDPGDGDRAVRTAVRGGVLRRLRDRAGVAGCGDAADLGVSAGGAGGADRGGCGALVEHRVPVGGQRRVSQPPGRNARSNGKTAG